MEVSGAPPTVWHVRDFLSADEESEILRCVDGAPTEKWVSLRGRKLQCLGGTPKPPPDAMVPEPLPSWVQSVCDALVGAGIFPADAPPNHCLVNAYEAGQGITAHKDGPLYTPRVAILSLGSVASFDFVQDDTERGVLASLLLPPRGLLVFGHDAYDQRACSAPLAMKPLASNLPPAVPVPRSRRPAHCPCPAERRGPPQSGAPRH